MRLLFWSGQSFEEEGLKKEGRFKVTEALAVYFGRASQALAKARDIQWDYRNMVRRKGRIVRVK